MALQFTILTAARSGEVRGAVWSEFDLKSGVWIIPGERMKAGEEHIVPLPSGALEILHVVGQARSSEVVFPGVRGGPLSDATLSKILREMGLRFTVHGFRSSFRDWAAETMLMPGEVAEAALAHSVTNKVEAAYRRTKFLSQRSKLMSAWDEFVRSEVEGRRAAAHRDPRGDP
jgi:integrase